MRIFASARPKSKKAVGRRPRGLSRRRAHALDARLADAVSLRRRAGGRRATITDIDGNTLDDFCLGDTGSMFGHSPPPVARAIRRQARRGLTYMLPERGRDRVGSLLTEMFGLPFWQIATTATDANRFALRVARAVTGRAKILVFNGCYHGAVDETMVRLKDGKPVNRPGLAGEFRDLAKQTRIVEFNDIEALERRLPMATSPASSPSRC